MHEVLVNRLGGLSLPRKSVVRLTDRPDMTLDVYRGRKTIKQQKQSKCVPYTIYRVQEYNAFRTPATTKTCSEQFSGGKFQNMFHCTWRLFVTTCLLSTTTYNPS